MAYRLGFARNCSIELNQLCKSTDILLDVQSYRGFAFHFNIRHSLMSLILCHIPSPRSDLGLVFMAEY